MRRDNQSDELKKAKKYSPSSLLLHMQKDKKCQYNPRQTVFRYQCTRSVATKVWFIYGAHQIILTIFNFNSIKTTQSMTGRHPNLGRQPKSVAEPSKAINGQVVPCNITGHSHPHVSLHFFRRRKKSYQTPIMNNQSFQKTDFQCNSKFDFSMKHID